MAPIISLQDLSVRFRGCEALADVQLSIDPGKVYALLGENGAGKTTLIRVLTGFQRASSGTCQVLGMDPARDAELIRRRVGYVSDAPALYEWMQIGEIGWFAASFYEPGFLDRFNDAVSRFELPTRRKIKHLSKGQRAKVALALAIAHDPELLILDEPTSGLDPLVRREFLESMLDRVATGRSVLLSSHQISEVERVADDVAILRNGSIQAEGDLQELRDSVQVVVFSVDDPLVALPTFDGETDVLQEETEGRQRRLVIRGCTEENLNWLRSRPQVRNVQARPASLDELFVAFTRGVRGRPATGNSASKGMSANRSEMEVA